MLAGTRMLAYTESWPAPLVIILPQAPRFPSTTSASPNKSLPVSVTHLMQSSWKFVAGDTKSVRHSTLQNRSEGAQPAFTPSTSSPAAMAAKAALQSFSTASTVSSLGERTSRLNCTQPGTVLVEPGRRFKIPVEARAPCLAAIRWLARIILLAVSRASARCWKDVAPV